jgi:hypothetical protein
LRFQTLHFLFRLDNSLSGSDNQHAAADDGDGRADTTARQLNPRGADGLFALRG